MRAKIRASLIVFALFAGIIGNPASFGHLIPLPLDSNGNVVSVEIDEKEPRLKDIKKELEADSKSGFMSAILSVGDDFISLFAPPTESEKQLSRQLDALDPIIDEKNGAMDYLQKTLMEIKALTVGVGSIDPTTRVMDNSTVTSSEAIPSLIVSSTKQQPFPSPTEMPFVGARETQEAGATGGDLPLVNMRIEATTPSISSLGVNLAPMVSKPTIAPIAFPNGTSGRSGSVNLVSGGPLNGSAQGVNDGKGVR